MRVSFFAAAATRAAATLSGVPVRHPANGLGEAPAAREEREQASDASRRREGFASSRRLPVATALIALFTLVASAPGLAPWLELSRSAIAGGELWRIVTGHFTHWSGEHLAWDLGAFVLLGAWTERSGRRRYLGLLLGACVAISLALLWLRPELSLYRGLSGLDSALFAALCATLLRSGVREGDRSTLAFAGLLALGFVAKLAGEAATGNALFVAGAGSVALIPLAHTAGAASGLAGSLLRTLWRKRMVSAG